MPEKKRSRLDVASTENAGTRDASAEALFEAQELAFDAFEASGPRRAALARQALAISPDCADAYLLLAEETAANGEEARELLEQGVAAGERTLGPEPFEEYVGYFWGVFETRPYMRARAALAEALWALDRREEAVEHHREMLRLNPNDNQGVRDLQVEWLLWLERYEELDALLAAYEEDDAATLVYTKALAAFARQGASPEAEQFLDAARESNPHVVAFLTGQEVLPERLPDFIGLGDKSEAIDYAAGATSLWASVPGALAWLARSSP